MRQLQLNLEEIKRLSEQNEDDNFEFRTFLKGQNSSKIDEVVHRLNKDISTQIDCTQCGNCCNELKPCVSNKEVNLLAKLDGISHKEFMSGFIEKDEFEPIFYLKSNPCKYLSNKRCSIYANRPNDCKSYPHLGKNQFVSRTYDAINNAAICPIVFNVYEQLKAEVGFKNLE